MKIKGKYKGNKKVELEEDLNLPIGTEVIFEIKDIAWPENKKEKNDDEHFLLKIAKSAKPFGRSDLSEKYHDILYSLE